MTDPRLSRRAFLSGMAATGAALLAACVQVLPTPSSLLSPSASPGPVSTPRPSDTPAPTPAEPTLRAKIGQMLLVGFRGTDAASASAVLSDISERGLGGVVLFSVDQPSGSAVRNIVSPEQLAALTGTLQRAAATSAPPQAPLLIAVDQEGGQVARLGPDHGFPPTVSAAELGAQDDAATTRRAGRDIARTLQQAGINLNLAPVVDLNLNPANPIIGALDRSFGADPDLVRRQAAAFIRGHHEIGVRTTLKHFPGHGSASGDTHLGVVDVTDSWQPVELEPFRDLIDDQLADTILTAHVFNAKLDPKHPATLSAATIGGILRRQLGWDGVVISDDMQMGAIRDAYGYADAVRLAVLAGIDILTIANQQVFEEGIVERTIELVAGMVEGGQIPERRINESWRRIQNLKLVIATAGPGF